MLPQGCPHSPPPPPLGPPRPLRHLQVDALRSSPAYQAGDIGAGLRECFFELDARALACNDAHLAGATATVAVVRGSKLWVAGVGDSRCVLSHAGTAQLLTNDHKPDDPAERARIQSVSAGGPGGGHGGGGSVSAGARGCRGEGENVSAGPRAA